MTPELPEIVLCVGQIRLKFEDDFEKSMTEIEKYLSQINHQYPVTASFMDSKGRILTLNHNPEDQGIPIDDVIGMVTQMGKMQLSAPQAVIPMSMEHAIWNLERQIIRTPSLRGKNEAYMIQLRQGTHFAHLGIADDMLMIVPKLPSYPFSGNPSREAF